MTGRQGSWLRVAVAVALSVEVLRHANWMGRVLSFMAVYDWIVWVMVALRAVVTALQASAAWALWGARPSGPVLGQWALTASAVLLGFELGLGLSPSSVTPGLRWPTVAAYAVYAALGFGVLRWSSADSTSA